MGKFSISPMKSVPLDYLNTKDRDITEFYNKAAWNRMNDMQCVVYELKNNNSIIGYVTASMNKLRIKLEKDEINYPSVLIGRLGVDKKFARKGYGSDLVHYIIDIVHEIKDKIGCRLLYVDVEKIKCKDTKELVDNPILSQFYEGIGFEKMKKKVKPTKTIYFFDIRNHG